MNGYQEPMGPPHPGQDPVPTRPPADDAMRDRLRAMLSANSQWLRQEGDPEFGLQPGMGESDAAIETLQRTAAWINSDRGIREFLRGEVEQIPTLRRREMVSAQQLALDDQERYAKKHNPGFYDHVYAYTAEPVASVGFTFFQTLAFDLPVGIYNVAAGATGLPTVEAPDLRSGGRALVRRYIKGETGSLSELAAVERANLDAMRDQIPLAGAASDAGSLVGLAASLRNPVTRAGAGMAGWALTKIGLSRFTTLKKFTQGAAGLATQSFLTARDEKGSSAPEITERLEHAAWGAAASVVGDTAGIIGRIAAGRLLVGGLKKLPESEAVKAREAFVAWSKKAGPAWTSGEGSRDFMHRAVKEWADAGTPGYRMPFRRALGLAAEAGAEAAGLSLVDAEMRSSVYESLFDTEKDERTRYEAAVDALVRLAGTTTGLLAIRAGSALEVPRKQREQPSIKVEPGPSRSRPEESEGPASEALVTAGRAPSAGQGPTDDLKRLGWEPVAVSPTNEVATVSLRDTGYTYRLQGNEAVPGDKLREALNLPDRMPADQFNVLLENTSMLSALYGKASLPGKEIDVAGQYAQAGDEAMPGVIRMMVLGEPMERPLADPSAKWTPSAGLAPRDADLIPQEQQKAAEFLGEIRVRRQDLWPEYQPILEAVTAVVARTSQNRDPAIGDAMRWMSDPGFAAALVSGSRQQAGDAIVSLGQILTTKTPEVLMQQRQQRPQPKYERDRARRQAVTEEGRSVEREADAQFTPSRLQKDVVQEAVGLARLGKRAERWWQDVLDSDGRMLRGNRVRQLAGLLETYAEQARRKHGDAEGQRRVQALDQLVETMSRRVSEAAAKKPEPDHDMLRATDRAGDSTQSQGEAQAAQAFSGIPLRGLETAASGIADVIRRSVSWVVDSQIDRMRALGEAPLADAARDAVTNARGYMAEAGVLLNNLGRMANRPIPELHDVVWDGDSGITRFYGMRDEAAGSHFGVWQPTPSGRASDVMQRVDEVYAQTRRWLSDVGATVTLKDGTVTPVARVATHRRMVRIWTPAMRDAMSNPQSLLRNKVLDETARLTSMSRESVERILTTDREVQMTDAVILMDALETARMIDLIPSHVRMGNQVHELLVATPFENAVAVSDSAARRAGFISVFGTGTKASPATSGHVPIGRVLENITPANRDAAIALVRSLHGMTPVGIGSRIDPASKIGRTAHAIDVAVGVYTALKLTFAAAQNVVEPFGAPATFLGYSRIAGGYRDLARAIIKRDVRGLVNDAIRSGALHYVVTDARIRDFFSLRDLDPQRRARKKARLFGNAINIPFHLTDMGAAIIVSQAVRRFTRDMRAGRGGVLDTPMIRRLGYSAEEARDIAAGRGTPQQYNGILRNSLARIMPARGEQPAETAPFAKSRLATSVFRLTGFVRKMVRNITDTMRQLGDKDLRPAERAAVWAKLLGIGVGAALTGTETALMNGLLRGDLGEKTREALDDPTAFATWAVVQGTVGASGASLADIAKGAVTDADKTKAEAFGAMTRMMMPISAIRAASDLVAEVVDWAASALPQADEKAVTQENVGRSLLSRLNDLASQNVPGYRVLGNGIFGINALAFNDRHAVEARSFFYRWMEANDFAEERPRLERDEFDEWMSTVSKKLLNGEPADDEFRASLRNAIREKGSDAVRASMLRRRMLQGSWRTRMSPADRTRFQRVAGRERWSTIVAHDARLEAMARILDDGD